MDNNMLLQRDTLRYKKNSLAANLALLALLFNCLYFCLLYAFKNAVLADGSSTWFSNILVGASVILTLVMLLTNFLASEGIKGYKKHFCIVLLVLAVIQIARIFIYPLYVMQHSEFTVTYFWIRNASNVFLGIVLVVWLSLSAACLIASAVIGYINCTKLESHLAAIESGEINVDEFFQEAKQEMLAATPDNAGAKAEEVK